MEIGNTAKYSVIDQSNSQKPWKQFRNRSKGHTTSQITKNSFPDKVGKRKPSKMDEPRLAFRYPETEFFPPWSMFTGFLNIIIRGFLACALEGFPDFTWTERNEWESILATEVEIINPDFFYYSSDPRNLPVFYNWVLQWKYPIISNPKFRQFRKSETPEEKGHRKRLIQRVVNQNETKKTEEPNGDDVINKSLPCKAQVQYQSFVAACNF